MPQCTACTHEGDRCKNTVNLVLRNLPTAVQRELHATIADRCVGRGRRECCVVCTTHAKEAIRLAYGPALARRGIDVAQMAFVTLLEMLSCHAFRMDGAACEEWLTGAQGLQRWGM